MVIDVIHTVGPIGENKEALQTAYGNCLDLAVEKKLRTIVSINIYYWWLYNINSLKCISGFPVHFNWCLW